MKLKKINKNGEFVVKMSQLEINSINELLGYGMYGIHLTLTDKKHTKI